MADVEITDEDRQVAEAFLEEVLVELIPDADFSPGSVTRDHTIGAVGAIVAYLRGEARKTRLASSLRTAGDLEDDADFTQAVDNIAANWFLTRRTGTRVRGTATIHFSTLHDGSMPVSTTFTRAAGVRYLLDLTSTYTYQKSDLSPRVDATGQIIDYTLRVPVVAENPGSLYQAEPGVFSSVSRFSTYITYAENETALTGGTDDETATELLERAPDAISVRDLNSKRSIAATITDQFPEVNQVVTLGMQDEGMRRDILELLSPDVIVHLGGYLDVYATTDPLENRVYEGTVGGTFTDAGLEITLFTDDSVTDWRDLDVAVGDVIRHDNALASEPTLYTILEVTKYYLRVSGQQSFPALRPVDVRGETFINGVVDGAAETVTSLDAAFTSDDVGRWVRITASTASNEGDYEITAVNETTSAATLDGNLTSPDTASFQVLDATVHYTIGDLAPSYANKVSLATTGAFSRTYQAVGKALLPQEPVYLIREVSLLDPADEDADATTGRVTFPVRVNEQPTAQSGLDLEYQIDVVDPLEAHSTRQMVTVCLGPSIEASGANGSFDNSNKFTAPSASFADADVGKKIRVLDAVLAVNKGEFTITSRTSSTLVEVDDDDVAGWSSSAEGQLSWELTNAHKYDGKVVRIVYDSMINFSGIASYVENPDRRVGCADTLLRGFHPVYLTMSFNYRVSANALRLPTTSELKTFTADFVNAFPDDEVLHASDVVAAIHQGFPNQVDSISLPLTINYDLIAPDGRLIPYVTTDAVSIVAAKLASSDPLERLEDPAALGVVDDNVRYLTDETLLTFTRVG